MPTIDQLLGIINQQRAVIAALEDQIMGATSPATAPTPTPAAPPSIPAPTPAEAGALNWGRSIVAGGQTPEFAFDAVKAQWVKDGHTIPLSFGVADLGEFRYPPLKAVQSGVDANGHPYPPGHIVTEAERLLQPKGVQYDAPPEGWPKASYDQTPKPGGRVWFNTSSQGRGYWVDKAVIDGLHPALTADWAAWGERMKAQAEAAAAAGIAPAGPSDAPVIENAP